MATLEGSAREALPTLPEACEPVSQVRRRSELGVVIGSRTLHAVKRSSKRMPTLIGVGGELWIEPVAQSEAELSEQPDARPRTLREDQPELAEAYRREAARILIRERDAWRAQAELASQARPQPIALSLAVLNEPAQGEPVLSQAVRHEATPNEAARNNRALSEPALSELAAE